MTVSEPCCCKDTGTFLLGVVSTIEDTPSTLLLTVLLSVEQLNVHHTLPIFSKNPPSHLPTTCIEQLSAL